MITAKWARELVEQHKREQRAAAVAELDFAMEKLGEVIQSVAKAGFSSKYIHMQDYTNAFGESLLVERLRNEGYRVSRLSYSVHHTHSISW